MRHVYFPSRAQADAFVQDLLNQGLIRPDLGQQALSGAEQRELGTARSEAARLETVTPLAGSTAETRSVAVTQPVKMTQPDEAQPHETSAEEIGLGAVRGTNAGLITGAVVGTVAALATGGLAAIPVMLGMAALGGGVGAGVGALGGAAGVDEIGRDGLDDDRRAQLSARAAGAGQLLAVEDAIPQDALNAALARHGGEIV